MNATPPEPREPKWWRSAWFKWGAIAALLIVGFYVHQNLMGALAWKKVQRDVAAAGESLDPASLIPAPVPDEQNFGALPIFALSSSGGYLGAHALIAALEKVKDSAMTKNPPQGSERDYLPYLGSWRKGEKLDRAHVQKKLAEMCHEPLGSLATPLELYAKLCPALADLRAENAKRPECSFPQGPNLFPEGKALGPITLHIKMAKVLAYEERLALDAGRPELALEDLQVAWKINSGLRKETSLVAGLVSVGVLAIQMEAIRQGLAEHAWNDQQLETIDHDLGQMDFLAEFQHDMRGETLDSIIPLSDYLKEHRELLTAFNHYHGSSRVGWSVEGTVAFGLTQLIPDGWLDQFKADNTRYRLLVLLPMVNVPTHRSFPEKEAKALTWVEDLPGIRPWRPLLDVTCAPVFVAAKKFSYAQVQIDEARLACRLERHRLAHGSYPEFLTELESPYGPNPLDPFNGQPYRYQRSKDGSFLLYSVGWNQMDDGGNVAGAPPEEAPDWAWLNQPKAP